MKHLAWTGILEPEGYLSEVDRVGFGFGRSRCGQGPFEGLAPLRRLGFACTGGWWELRGGVSQNWVHRLSVDTRDVGGVCSGT